MLLLLDVRILLLGDKDYLSNVFLGVMGEFPTITSFMKFVVTSIEINKYIVCSVFL